MQEFENWCKSNGGEFEESKCWFGPGEIGTQVEVENGEVTIQSPDGYIEGSFDGIDDHGVLQVDGGNVTFSYDKFSNLSISG